MEYLILDTDTELYNIMGTDFFILSHKKTDCFYPKQPVCNLFKVSWLLFCFFQGFSDPFQSVTKLSQQCHDLRHSIIFTKTF